MATTFERLDDRINMLRSDANKPEMLVEFTATLGHAYTSFPIDVEGAIRKAYAQGRKDQHRETAALFRGIMAT